MTEKKRLDTLVYELGLTESREKARALIMMGDVYADNQKADKPGTMLPAGTKIEVRGGGLPYVSRGGLKLEKAMSLFPIGLNGKTCMDIGASTGGFTDCMLQNGASKVYSIDVGYGQLAWKLRTDPRVVNIEKCNVRYLDPALIEDPIDFISIDVSFISLKLILPVAARVLSEEGTLVCLVKPQFEAGKEEVDKGSGIIRDEKIHEQVIEKCVGYAEENGFVPYGLTFSPVKGAKGNREFLLYVGKNENMRYNLSCIQRVVKCSHEELK